MSAEGDGHGHPEGVPELKVDLLQATQVLVCMLATCAACASVQMRSVVIIRRLILLERGIFFVPFSLVLILRAVVAVDPVIFFVALPGLQFGDERQRRAVPQEVRATPPKQQLELKRWKTFKFSKVFSHQWAGWVPQASLGLAGFDGEMEVLAITYSRVSPAVGLGQVVEIGAATQQPRVSTQQQHWLQCAVYRKH